MPSHLRTRPASASGGLDTADGYVPVGGSVSPFSDVAAVERLEPGLRRAIRRAAGDARAAGVGLEINSGWRSARYQRLLFDRAVAKYGSAAAAARFVKPADESEHVRGLAVDVGPWDAASWLETNGSRYGLCRVYANERWHFERTIEDGGTCPPLIADAAG